MSNAPVLGGGIFTTLLETDNYTVKCEEKSGMPFIHWEVQHFNKSLLKEMREVAEEIKEAFRYFGHEEIYAYVPKAKVKFSKTISDPETIAEIEHLGIEYEVLRWDL